VADERRADGDRKHSQDGQGQEQFDGLIVLQQMQGAADR
jgi:hypothetical protein